MSQKRQGQSSRRSGPSRADPEQYQRFLDAARELGCDESEEAFEQAVRTVARPRRASDEADYIREVEYEVTDGGVRFIGSRIISPWPD